MAYELSNQDFMGIYGWKQIIGESKILGLTAY
jgi:hypothetical protein